MQPHFFLTGIKAKWCSGILLGDSTHTVSRSQCCCSCYCEELCFITCVWYSCYCKEVCFITCICCSCYCKEVCFITCIIMLLSQQSIYTYVYVYSMYSVFMLCMCIHTHTHTHTIDNTLSTSLNKIWLVVDLWEPNYWIHTGALFKILFW
jgi:hypothetical protein